jgi:hypothetical protein
VDGVYFDQITAMPPSICYHSRHGHAPGGGTHYWRGYDRALAKIQGEREGEADRFLSSELLADAFLDRIDLYLPFVPPLEDYVPLFPALYGDYALLMGRSTPAPVMEDRQLMALCQGEQFLFGAQLGWTDDSILERPEAARYLRELAHLRSRVHDALTGARMLPPPIVDCQPKNIELRIPAALCGRERDLSLRRAPVRASAWRHESGQRLILVLNESAEPSRARLTLPEGWTAGECRGWFLGNPRMRQFPHQSPLELDLPEYGAAAVVWE